MKTVAAFVDKPADTGKRIRFLRKERRLTGKQLASEVGLSTGHISMVENGFHVLTIEKAEKFASALGVSLSDLGTLPHDTTADIPDSSLSVFTFDSQRVRALDINGTRWVVAVDGCRVLGVTNVSESVSRLDSSDVLKLRRTEDCPHTCVWRAIDPRVTEMLLVSDDGVTEMLLSSRKKIALAFRRWIVKEVFASVRDTGRYELNTSISTAVSAHMEFVYVPMERLYVVEIVGFGTKVGVSSDIHTRLAQLRSEANRWGYCLGRAHVTDLHDLSRSREKAVISRFSPNGSEYMKGVEFSDVAKYVSSHLAQLRAVDAPASAQALVTW